jgi:hypothetical protein
MRFGGRHVGGPACSKKPFHASPAERECPTCARMMQNGIGETQLIRRSPTPSNGRSERRDPPQLRQEIVGSDHLEQGLSGRPAGLE